MGPYVIIGIIILGAFTIFIWFVRITSNKKKLKTVHRTIDGTQAA
ncbi:MAG: hypothetical protein V4478_03405 [Patescibacteria group bacterium]